MSAQSRSGGGGGMQTVGYIGEQFVLADPASSVRTVVSAAAASSRRFGSPSGAFPHAARMQPSNRTSARVENVPSLSALTTNVAVAEVPASSAANEQLLTHAFAVQLPSGEPEERRSEEHTS